LIAFLSGNFFKLIFDEKANILITHQLFSLI
jgi:hypothetical protein